MIRADPSAAGLVEDLLLTDRHDAEPDRGVTAAGLDALEAVELHGPIFRSFAEDGFRPWDAWQRLRGILGTNGGCYGLVGARGSGKSWLMQRAVLEAQQSGGVGLWFPSPSEFEPQPFLSALSDNFASEIEEMFGGRRRQLLGGLTTLLFASIALVTFAGFILVGAFRSNLEQIFSAAALALGSTGFLFVLVGFWRSITPRGMLLAKAGTLRERIRYSQTLKETGEAGVAAGKGLLSFKSSRGRELVERPTTTSSLVYDLRELARRTAKVVAPGKVVIAIDELDKMSDPVRVRGLLRDVKGIFEIEGVHFLVSVSYEAARMLKLAGVVDRDEFNSSFYAVQDLPALSPSECAEMLALRSALSRQQTWRNLKHRRKLGRATDEKERDQSARLERWAEAEQLRALSRNAKTDKDRERADKALGKRPYLGKLAGRLDWFEERQQVLARAIAVLAAGNARETVRLYASVPTAAFSGTAVHAVPCAMRAAMSTEFTEFRREAFAFVSESPTDDDADSTQVLQDRARPGSLNDDEQAGLFMAVRELDGEGSLAGQALHLVEETWNPTWATDLWRTKFQEEWRRLLVRLYAASYLAEHPPMVEDEDLLRLRDAVGHAAESAIVGWLLVCEPPFNAPPFSPRESDSASGSGHA